MHTQSELSDLIFLDTVYEFS